MRSTRAAAPATAYATDLWNALDRLARVSEDLGDERLQAEVAALRARVAEGRFYVACVGQFKRGKSTLINALVGQHILPCGVLPLTTVPTVVRAGPGRARVRLANRGWQDIPLSALELYVSEERNPGNRADVQAVEVYVQHARLANGLCLVDTPGLGSVFTANTTATQEFLPQVDAVLAVIGADPPLSGDELDLLETVSAHTTTLLIVLNKADRVSDTECRQAMAFASRVIAERLRRSSVQIYQVSAAEQLAGDGPARDWHALTSALDALASRTGPSLVADARARGVARLSARCLSAIDNLLDAIRRPIEEFARRVDAIRQCATDTARHSLRLGHLFAADEDALRAAVARRRDAFLDRWTGPAVEECRRRFAALPSPRLRRQAVALAREVAERTLAPWLAEEETRVETDYCQLADRFVALANDFLNQLAATGELPVASLPHALPPEAGFRLNRHFYFHDLPILVAATAKQQWWFDRLRPRASARHVIWRDTDTYLRQLLEMNTTRVLNDLDERVAESRRHLQAEVQSVLDTIHTSADRALDRARRTRDGGAGAVESELVRLSTLQRDLEDLVKSASAQATSAEGQASSLAST